MVRLQQPVQPGQLRSKQSVPQCYSTKPIRTQEWLWTTKGIKIKLKTITIWISIEWSWTSQTSRIRLLRPTEPRKINETSTSTLPGRRLQYENARERITEITK